MLKALQNLHPGDDIEVHLSTGRVYSVCVLETNPQGDVFTDGGDNLGRIKYLLCPNAEGTGIVFQSLVQPQEFHVARLRAAAFQDERQSA